VLTAGNFRDEIDFLSLLGEDCRRRLLERSTRTVKPAGAIAYRPDDPPPAILLDHGLLRVYWSNRDGRQATVAFIHSKELIGASNVGRPMPYFLQVVTESTMTTLDTETVRAVAAEEVELVRAIAIQLAMRVRNTFRLVAVRSLGSIRDRLAYDLLERACQSQLVMSRLEAKATHTQLADSIGSSREVVSRALQGLRGDGIVDTLPGVVRVLDPIRLAEVVRSFVI
jgi:CRP-like cAMP-binding protein